jgi:predicted deacylase
LKAIPFAQLEVERLEPGTKGGWMLEDRATEPAVTMPFHYVKGRDDGTVLLILAAVHGDEYEGVQTVLELIREFEPDDLRGTLLLVPVTNTAAYAAKARVTPVDGKNLARVFPGNPEGTYSERLAWLITERLIAKADFLLDLHSGGYFFRLPPLVGYDHTDTEAGRRSRAAAEAFGMEIVWGHPAVAPGPTLQAARRHGVPWLYTEGSGGLRVNRAEQQRYKQGAVNLMEHLGMLQPHVAAARERKPFTIRHRLYGMGNLDASIRATADGFFIPAKELLDEVGEGETIGVICDWFGREREAIRADRSGVVVSLVGTPKVQAGDLIAFITGKLPIEGDRAPVP